MAGEYTTQWTKDEAQSGEYNNILGSNVFGSDSREGAESHGNCMSKMLEIVSRKPAPKQLDR